MPARFSYRVRVRYAECDLQGNVFNAHYLTWFDDAFGELIAHAGGKPYRELVESGVDAVVAEARIRYLAPARLDDELTIEIALAPLTTTSMTSDFTVARGDLEIATASLRHVCYDLNARGKRPWPEELRKGLEAYVDAGRLGAA
jgi:acyl-CoA thioester hydrolase